MKFTHWADRLVLFLCIAWVIAVAAIASGPSGGFVQLVTSPSTAGWAQAFGTVGAIWATWNVANRVAERERERERGERRAQTLALHARALGLAQVAVNCLAKVEAAITPVIDGTDLSELRNIVETELAVVQQFPVWQLPNGDSMVIFTAFPGLLLSCSREIERAEQRLNDIIVVPDVVFRNLKNEVRRSYEICDRRGRELRNILDNHLALPRMP